MQTKHLKILIPSICLCMVILGIFLWPKNNTSPAQVGTSSSSNGLIENFPKDQKLTKSEFEGFVKTESGKYIPEKPEQKNSGNFTDNASSSNNNSSSTNSELSAQNLQSSQSNSQNNQANPKNNPQDNPEIAKVQSEVDKIVNTFLQNTPKISADFPKYNLPNTSPLPKPITAAELPNLTLNANSISNSDGGACGLRGLVVSSNFENGYEIKSIKNTQLTPEQNNYLVSFVNGQAGTESVNQIFRDTCTEKNIEFLRDLGTIGTKYGNTRAFAIKDGDLKYLAVLQIRDNWVMLSGSPLNNAAQDAILGLCGIGNFINIDENTDANNADNSALDQLDACIEQNTNSLDIESGIKTRIGDMLNIIN